MRHWHCRCYMGRNNRRDNPAVFRVILCNSLFPGCQTGGIQSLALCFEKVRNSKYWPFPVSHLQKGEYPHTRRASVQLAIQKPGSPQIKLVFLCEKCEIGHIRTCLKVPMTSTHNNQQSAVWQTTQLKPVQIENPKTSGLTSK